MSQEYKDFEKKYNELNQNIRKELLELTQQTPSHAVNKTDETIAKFLNGEIELSVDEVNKLKSDFHDNWIKQKELTPKQKSQLEKYSYKEYGKLPDSEWDETVDELLHNSVENRKNIKQYMSIVDDGKDAIGKQWNKDEIFKFTNGTSETRARMFLSEGKGYTKLESLVYVPGEKYLSQTGLQISPYGTAIGERSAEYAKMQSARFRDRPVIIEGEIPAQYVYRNRNGIAEFGIPHQYYDKITSARILDARSGIELYTLKDGVLSKSDSFIEATLPELKIKQSNSNQKIFYHGGIESDFSYDKLDLLRASEKQGSKYAGFYMYGEENLEGAMKYAKQENSLKKTNSKGVARISLDDNLKIYEKTDFGGITRIKPEELKALQEQGYDMISGKMMGKTEYVLLNKNKISSIEFMPLDGSDPMPIYSRDTSNNIEKLTAKEAFAKYGLDDDRFYTSQGLDPVQQKEKIRKLNSGRKPFDNTPTETKEFNQKLKDLGITEEEYYKQFKESLKSKKQRKTKKGPKFKKAKIEIKKTNKQIFKEQLEQAGKELASKNNNQATKSLTKKSLSGGGKVAIGVAIAGLVAGGIVASKKSSNKPKSKKQKRPHQLSRTTNSEEIDNSYAMQMAQDISSYRYGKHMTGFVNH